MSGTVLDSIIEGVLIDLEARRISETQLAELIAAAPEVRNSVEVISKKSQSGKIAVISEVKRSSPSKGELAEISDPVALAKEYEAGGAATISVLTEERRFKGSVNDFHAVRAAVNAPMLRKDFIVTEYQVKETRALGGDLQLLIVAALSDSQLRDFYQLTSELGMNSLIEIHDEIELERALEINPAMIGVNARNLKTLEVDLLQFQRILPLIPSSIVKIAESGISTAAEVAEIRNWGADGILVGETLVKSSNPRLAIAELTAGI